ncbi:hypothetical protein MES5069_310085 [Mesorhizobium escarrei]|uniref:Transposase n=1 Tax=Mesorhizobium escarrei TaxID=666018 RepID=A0ABN8JWY6_9HYPH|nr:hypothetical protein MES5069_310085 [Mesorhizobium escarrei]
MLEVALLAGRLCVRQAKHASVSRHSDDKMRFEYQRWVRAPRFQRASKVWHCKTARLRISRRHCQ